MPAQVAQITQPRGSPRGQVKGVLAQPRHGHFHLDPAARVQELCVDGTANRYIHLSGCQTVECDQRIGAGDIQLSERAEINQRRSLIHYRCLGLSQWPPSLIADRVRLCRAVIQPALPPGGQAEMRPGLGPAVVQSTFAQTATGLGLFEGPVQGKKICDCLFHTCGHVIWCCGGGVDAGEVHLPHVHGRVAVDNPIRQRPPDPRRRHHPDRVHTGSHKQSVDRGLPHQRSGVGGKAFGTVHEMLDTNGFKARTQFQRRFHEGGELIPVFTHLKEGAIALGAIRIPALGVGFKSPDHQLACVSLDVDTTIQIPNDRKRIWQIGDRLGHHIHVLYRLQR